MPLDVGESDRPQQGRELTVGVEAYRELFVLDGCPAGGRELAFDATGFVIVAPLHEREHVAELAPATVWQPEEQRFGDMGVEDESALRQQRALERLQELAVALVVEIAEAAPPTHGPSERPYPGQRPHVAAPPRPPPVTGTRPPPRLVRDGVRPPPPRGAAAAPAQRQGRRV